MILDFKISSLAGKVKLSRSQLVELVKMNGERHVGVALDYSPRGRYALHWAVENILRAIDHFIVVVVNKDGLEAGRAALWEASGTSFIPLAAAENPHNQHAYHLKIDEEVTKTLHEAEAKKIVVVFKLYWGDQKEMICNADAPLDHLIMGCRGHSKLKRYYNRPLASNDVPSLRGASWGVSATTSRITCPVLIIVKLPPC
uniref:UspA domain-containing protein n=1 Tax=Physcomitrium patens TaxID=3218 RepID=A0A2K1JKA0_PHYPA|nr:uncharacterized protein LOC112290361 isoform X2 [Physcomitrium patens]PNR42012.1 hypothetical protein PHYPA_016841 [Physcomitrium patens]|eukprot:XP_024392306.1 uncharacterized protein LOC112290361 isoform X2 [Physcomitrella patens]